MDPVFVVWLGGKTCLLFSFLRRFGHFGLILMLCSLYEGPSVSNYESDLDVALLGTLESAANVR